MKTTTQGNKSTSPKKTTQNSSKSSSSVKSTPSANTQNKSSNNNDSQMLTMMILLFVGVVILLIMVSFSFYNITKIDEKVTRLDSFFANNAQGYESGDSESQGNQAPGTGEQQPSNQAPDTQEVGEPDIENRPMLGDPDAPITIVEYSDFECPFCQRYFQETYPQLKEEYIDTGKVNVVYKDFPLSNIHPLAEPAAIASKCVFKISGSNETFIDYHDTIFENQGQLSESSLKSWATDLGISESEYETCIENPDIKSQVDADFNEGSQFGISGTPSFVIEGELLVGAQPISAFRDVIDPKLE